jgi:endoglycosylceramidase
MRLLRSHCRPVLTLVVLAGLWAWPSTVAARPGGFVRAPGGPFLVDPQGRRLELHGVNLVAKCAAYTHASQAAGQPCLPGAKRAQPAYVLESQASDPGRRFTARDALTLRRLGFSVVRLGMIWAGLEPGPGGAHENDPRYCSMHTPGTPYPALGAADPYRQATINAYLNRMGRIVSLLAREHIRVLLDMHQDAWGRPFANPSSATPWMAEGAPAWATCTSSAPFQSPAAWQGAYTDPAVNAAFQHFWANDVRGDLQAQYIRVLAAVARHFSGSRDVLGYEVFNEPSGPFEANPPVFDRQLQCFYAGSRYAPASCAAAPGPAQPPARGAIPALLAAAPHQLVFFEAPVLTDYGSPETIGITEALPFRRLVLSFHDYGGVPGAHSFQCSQASCATQEQHTMAQFGSERAATRTSQRGGPAWLLSEFGAESYVPDVARMAHLADQHLLSWTYWSGFQLHDPTGGPGEGLINERTRRPDPARAAVLARTYPLATAGIPESQSFVPGSGAFDFSYRPDHRVRAPTEIVVPTAYHYPYGYTVRVRGARVTSRPGAPMLTLVNQPHASEVTVTLRARAAHRRQHPAGRRHAPHRRCRKRQGSCPGFTG